MTTAPVSPACGHGRFGNAARRFVHDERGATAIEYSLIVALIFLAIVGAVKAYVNSTSEMYSEISSTMGGS